MGKQMKMIKNKIYRKNDLVVINQTLSKGITLVALVITIIVLLILAGISISQLSQSGLFEKVQIAKNETENAQEQEIAELDKFLEKLEELNVPYEGKGYKFIYDGSLKSEGIEGQNMKNELTGGWSTARTSYSVDGVNYYWYNRLFIYK